MAAATARTILVTRVPGGSNAQNSQVSQIRLPSHSNVNMENLFDVGNDGTRKRRRLTNLSPEERMLRRKLKNRVAAQTARDRKKERMTELEEAVAELEAENKLLLEENQSLQSRTSSLSMENVELRERLGMPVDESVLASSVKTESGFESAALLAIPQQKELALALLHCFAHSALILFTASLMCCLASSSRTAVLTSNKQLQPQTCVKSALIPSLQHNTRNWWGPQQQSWNPSMN